MVAEAIDRVRTEAESKEVTLVAGGTPGLHVRGDAALVTTAVRNLLDNAIRYSGPRTRVSVGLSVDEAGGSGVAGATDGADSADRADGADSADSTDGADLGGSQAAAAESAGDQLVRIAVVDQGIGIAKEAQERVFERFYRVDKARSRATGGTGLGLSIVKHVAADHGGTVELWSTPGRGSTFTLVLPRLIPDQPDQASAGPEPEAAAAVASGAAGAAFAAIAAISDEDQA